MSRKSELFLIDIIIAIDKLYRYAKEFENGEALLHDEKTWDATIREFEIIGEATKQLIRTETFDLKWQIVVDFRNMIIHEYFGIDPDEVFDIIKNDLESFEEYIKETIKIYDKNDFLQLLESAIEDNKYNKNIVSMLNQLKQDI